MVFGAELAASWGGPLAAAKDLLAGEVSLIARGNDSPLVRNQTMRVNVANAKFLARHRADVLGFPKHTRNPSIGLIQRWLRCRPMLSFPTSRWSLQNISSRSLPPKRLTNSTRSRAKIACWRRR